MKQSWEHLQLLSEKLSERELAILQALVFCDLYHVLELYVTYQKAKHPTPPASDLAPPEARVPDLAAFPEFLFDL